jgi:hypothetical protein
VAGREKGSGGAKRSAAPPAGLARAAASELWPAFIAIKEGAERRAFRP